MIVLEELHGWIMGSAITFLIAGLISMLFAWGSASNNDREMAWFARFFWVIAVIFATALAILSIIAMSFYIATQ